MNSLTAEQVTLFVAAGTLVGGLLGWFGKGIAFLLARWWTKSPKQEKASYLNTVADLAGKLRAQGMTIDEVRQFEEVLQSPSIKASQGATRAVEQLANKEPDAFNSNYGMKTRTAAELGVAEAKLNQALQDLHLLVGEDEWALTEKAQALWAEYRDVLAEAARIEFDGGTHAGLAAVLTALAETDRRSEEVRALVAERAAR